MEAVKFVNFYSVLGVSKCATKKELKRQYHNLILKHHPDKSKTEDSNSYFYKINEAWKTLNNDQLKNEYDAKLKAWEFENIQPIHEKVNIINMEKTSEDRYERRCRCGGLYLVNQEFLSSNSDLMIECDSCSLTILVYT